MTVDPQACADMSLLDVGIIAPFLLGIEDYSEDKIAEEVLFLKPLVNSISFAESKSIIERLSKEGKHSEIIPALRDRVNELHTANKGGFMKWLFGRGDKLEQNIPHYSSSASNMARSSTTVHSSSIVHPKPRAAKAISSSSLTSNQSMTLKGHFGESEAPIPVPHPGCITERLIQEELTMSKVYDFGRGQKNSNSENDSDFETIFGRFLDSVAK